MVQAAVRVCIRNFWPSAATSVWNQLPVSGEIRNRKAPSKRASAMSNEMRWQAGKTDCSPGMMHHGEAMVIQGNSFRTKRDNPDDTKGDHPDQ